MSAADDHRNGDCWGDDRCPVCAVEDAERLAGLDASPYGTRVRDKDSDVWVHVGRGLWAPDSEPDAEPDELPTEADCHTIEHIDRTWGPVEVTP